MCFETLCSFVVLSEKTHLTAFRQVAQSAHLTQAVDDAAANAGGLLQLLDGEVLLPMEGGVFQRIGSRVFPPEGREGVLL